MARAANQASRARLPVAFALPQRAFENRPVSGSWYRNGRVGLLEQRSTEVEYVRSRAGTGKDPRVRADTHDTREHLWSYSVRRGSIDDGLQPLLVSHVVCGIRAKGVDQDVNVRKDQSRPSIRSKSEALSSRSMPGNVPPPARHSGSTTGRCSARLIGRRSTSSSPCSIREVRVVLRLAASARARSSSVSSKRTVVLMRQSILLVCQYVYRSMGCEGSEFKSRRSDRQKTSAFRQIGLTRKSGHLPGLLRRCGAISERTFAPAQRLTWSLECGAHGTTRVAAALFPESRANR